MTGPHRLPLLALAPLALVLALTATGCGKKVDPFEGMSPENRLVAEMLGAVGGHEAYKRCAVIKFTVTETTGDTLVSARNHDFDRVRGDYVISWKAGDAEWVKVTLNLKRGPDSATALRGGGIPIPRNEERFEPTVKQAMEFILHDTYLAFAPYRLAEDKPKLTYYGIEDDPAGRPAQKLAIAQTRDGLTLTKEYVYYVDNTSKRPMSWTIKAGAGDVSYRWDEWRAEPPIMMAHKHTQVGGDRAFEITKVHITELILKP